MAKGFHFLKDIFDEEDKLKLKTRFGKIKEPYLGHFKAFKHKTYRGASKKMSYGTKYNNSESKQMCTFRSSHRYVKALHVKHLAYIQKEGKGINGTDPELYGPDPENYEKYMSKKHYRFIISPENQNVDIKELVQDFMDRLEKRTGHPLIWVAANHYNTGKNHAHVIVNGFDYNRKQVSFSRDEINLYMRETLKDICTEMVGPRTITDRMNSYRLQSTSNRLTSLDKKLVNIIENNGFVDKDIIFKIPDISTHLFKRLLHLESLNLARYDGSKNRYVFKKGWQDNLKLYGKYDTYLEGFQLTNAPASNYRLHDIKKSGQISGKVFKRYFMQENSYYHAVILETSPGQFSYVPLQEAPSDIKTGNNIKIQFEKIFNKNGQERMITKIVKIT